MPKRGHIRWLEMERKIEASDRFDLVYVPGGIGAGQLSQNSEVLEFLRAHQREGRWVAANCAGVGVLHRAGILAGRAAVTCPRRALRRAVNYGLLNFDSPDADFGAQALSNRKGDEQQTWGVRGGLSITPRVKLGRLLFRSKLSVAAYRFDAPGPYVYEADLDTLLGTTDVVFDNRSDILFELHDGPGAETLLLGPMVETRRTVASALARTRVGAALWYVPSEHWQNLRQPRLYAQAGITTADPNRQGEPFVTLGFGADFY